MNERIARAVMQLYEGASIKVTVGNGMSDVFIVKLIVHEGSVL